MEFDFKIPKLKLKNPMDIDNEIISLFVILVYIAMTLVVVVAGISLLGTLYELWVPLGLFVTFAPPTALFLRYGIERVD